MFTPFLSRRHNLCDNKNLDKLEQFVWKPCVSVLQEHTSPALYEIAGLAEDSSQHKWNVLMGSNPKAWRKSNTRKPKTRLHEIVADQLT
jgi:hypothetical protein